MPGILRVKAGDPVSSYLMQKLEGHAAVGARMPFGGPYLSADVIAVVAQWIADGALRSSAAAIAAPFALVTSAPASGEILQEPPPQIMLGFNHDLDLTRLGPGVVHLDWVGEDQANPSAGIVPARVTAPPGNSRVLLLWPASRLPHAQYRLMLRAGSSGIADIGGASPASGPGDPALSDESTETPLITFEIEGAP